MCEHPELPIANWTRVECRGCRWVGGMVGGSGRRGRSRLSGARTHLLVALRLLMREMAGRGDEVGPQVHTLAAFLYMYSTSELSTDLAHASMLLLTMLSPIPASGAVAVLPSRSPMHHPSAEPHPAKDRSTLAARPFLGREPAQRRRRQSSFDAR